MSKEPINKLPNEMALSSEDQKEFKKKVDRISKQVYPKNSL